MAKHIGTKDEHKWGPFLRQLMTVSGAWCIYFAMGVVYGAPTVYIPQLRRQENDPVEISDDMASWLSSAFSYASFPWLIIMPTLATTIGRKKTAIFTSIVTTSSFMVFYFSSTPTQLLIAEAMFGVTQASIVTTCVIIVSEYTSPRYRGFFLTCKGATLYWGIWVSNTIGTFTNWKYIPLVGFICSMFSLNVFFWPESPVWLAKKQRFVECRKAHRILKGTNEESEKELEALIKSQLDDDKVSLRDMKFVYRRDFYMPLLISMLTVAQYHLSGKFVITMYAIDVIKKIIGNERTAYKAMLLMDGITVLSSYIGCVLSRFCKRRTLLLSSACIATTFLFLTSLYLFLINSSVISEHLYVSLFLLSGFSLSISCGPLIMASTIYGEIIKVKYKGISLIIIGFEHVLLHSVLVKLGPYLFKVICVYGTFLLFALCSLMILVVLYFYLPETKDKTLSQLEEFFEDENSEEVNRLMAKPQNVKSSVQEI